MNFVKEVRIHFNFNFTLRYCILFSSFIYLKFDLKTSWIIPLTFCVPIKLSCSAKFLFGLYNVEWQLLQTLYLFSLYVNTWECCSYLNGGKSLKKYLDYAGVYISGS